MKILLLSLIYLCTVFSASAKELTVGVAELDYAPFYYEIEGQYYGAAVEVSQVIAKTLGHNLVFSRAPWKRIQLYLRSGDIDMMILYFKTPERSQDVVYVDIPHIYESSNLFVVKNSDIKFKGDILGMMEYKFGNVRGYSHGAEYNNAKGIDRQEFNNEKQLIKVLTYDRIDIGVGNKPVIISHAEEL